MKNVKRLISFLWNLFCSFGQYKIEKQDALIKKFNEARDEKERKAVVSEISNR